MIVCVDLLAEGGKETYRVSRKSAILRLAPTRAKRPVQVYPSDVRKSKESEATESQIESAHTNSIQRAPCSPVRCTTASSVPSSSKSTKMATRASLIPASASAPLRSSRHPHRAPGAAHPATPRAHGVEIRRRTLPCDQKKVRKGTEVGVFCARKDRLWRRERRVKDVEPRVALQKIGYRNARMVLIF